MNHDRFVRPRRVAGVLLVLAAAAALASCGRENRLLVPKVTTPYTWTNKIRHLLADRSSGTAPTGCTSCHHAGTGIPDWSDYQTVVDDATEMRNRLSVDGNMRQFLAEGEPEIVIAWIDAGTPR